MSVEETSKSGLHETPPQEIILGTRGSELALAQTRIVKEALARTRPSLKIAIEVIRTTGDQKPTAGRKGIFTAELERALMEKRIDVAVHSAKDLPSEIEGALTITAVLPRGAVEDLLLRKNAAPTSLATIATGSVRRQRQARWSNPAARVVGLRGNVPTLLRKFIESDWDAIILARAGLERLGFTPPEFEFQGQKLFAEILPLENFVSAGGQGVIALQTRAADLVAQEIVSSIDDEETHLCLRAEREFLRLLQGDCDLPVGVHARFMNGVMELQAQVFGDKSDEGKCFLVGAGPGDLGLVTLRAKELLERADVIVYDALANPEMLSWAPVDAEIIFAGKRAGEKTLSQDEINALLIEKSGIGKNVVRLKGGDPFVFGRGG
ncbi:MAG: hydroxymethylbilane synthase, partial [Verrucomicrobia bacterium]